MTYTPTLDTQVRMNFLLFIAGLEQYRAQQLAQLAQHLTDIANNCDIPF